MADTLKGDPFFGTRVINFAQSLLSGAKKLDPITDFEKKLLKHADELKKLDGEIEGGLIPILREGMDYVPPPVALRMLLYLSRFDLSRKGHEIIHFAARDRLALSDDEINQLVSEVRRDPHSNIEWSLALLGEPDPEEDENTTKKNALNLPNDFK